MERRDGRAGYPLALCVPVTLFATFYVVAKNKVNTGPHWPKKNDWTAKLNQNEKPNVKRRHCKNVLGR
jgi:hypothetical protein